MSVSEIKKTAKMKAQVLGRGASAMSLIGIAQTQTLEARACESSGDSKGALSALITAGTLTQMFMDTAEFKVQSGPGKKGVSRKEFQDFARVSCAARQDGHVLIIGQRQYNNLKQQVDVLAANLEELDKPPSWCSTFFGVICYIPNYLLAQMPWNTNQSEV
jgi:hypothetical protein